MVDATVDGFGALHVLVNNAALVDPAHFARDVGVVDLDVEVWDRVMAVNVRSVMLGCKHAIPRMIEAGGGSIVNMSSGSAKFGDFVRTAYGSSKAAINTLTKYVATQHGRDGVRVNAIAPGLVLTPPAFANLTPEHRDRLESNLLTPFVGEPADVAHDGALPRVRRVALRDRPGVAGERRPVGAPADLRPAARGPASPGLSGSGTVRADDVTTTTATDTTRRGTPWACRAASGSSTP